MQGTRRYQCRVCNSSSMTGVFYLSMQGVEAQIGTGRRERRWAVGSLAAVQGRKARSMLTMQGVRAQVRCGESSAGRRPVIGHLASGATPHSVHFSVGRGVRFKWPK